MNIPSVVRIRRGVRNGTSVVVQGCDVYIGRSCYQGGWSLSDSIWRNPFPISKYDIDTSLALYRQHILQKIETDPQTYDLTSLIGKTLGCWCGNGRAIKCHGNVLIDIMQEKNII